jgi:hypothetical protein
LWSCLNFSSLSYTCLWSRFTYTRLHSCMARLQSCYASLWSSYTGLRSTEYSCFWSHFCCVRSFHIRIFIIILYHWNILCLKKLSFEFILIMHIFYMTHVIDFINILLSSWKKFSLNLHVTIIWVSWSCFLNSILVVIEPFMYFL